MRGLKPSQPTVDKTPFILILGDTSKYFRSLSLSLHREGYKSYAKVIPDDPNSLNDGLISRDLNPAVIIIDTGGKNVSDQKISRILTLASTSYSGVPILVISEKDDLSLRFDAFQAGVTRYLKRPYSLWTLCYLLEELTVTPNDAYSALILNDGGEMVPGYVALLARMGVQPKTVSSHAELVHNLSELTPDIVILDLSSEISSALQLLSILRENESLYGLSVMTIRPETDDKKTEICDSEGVEYYSLDQSNLNDFSHKVRMLCGKSQRKKSMSRRLTDKLYESDRERTAFNLHALMSVADAGGNISYVNNRFCEVSGYRSDELMGQNHRIIKSGVHDNDFYHNMWSVISLGEVWQGEVCNRRKDGSFYWVESTIVPFLNKAGKPYQYVSVRTDISELKSTQESFESTLMLLEKASAAANIGQWELDLDTMCHTWSQSTRQIYEVGEDLTINFDRAISFFREGESRKTMARVFNESIVMGKNFDEELECQTEKGNDRWVRAIGLPVYFNNKCKKIYGLIQDVTERKINDLSLMLARDQADNANKAKSSFLSSMSHELRTPMNAILGFCQLLKNDELLNDDQQDNVQEILGAGEHLLVLINEVLDLSKVESGQMDLTFTNVDLSKLLVDCISLVENISTPRKIRIDFSGVRNQKVKADNLRLKQALVNLLSNAIKYNRDGGSVIVSVNNVSKGYLRISVADTGKGILNKDLDELFIPFNRLSAEGGFIEGTGIGLALTKRIVEKMNGRVGVSSELSVGSTFWIELPSGEAGHLENAGLVNISEDLAVLQRVESSTVLYIEDNRANLRLVSQLLKRHIGVNLIGSEEPIDGLELARKHRPKIILLDINLPGMDGYKVLEIIQSDNVLKDIPVVAITANAMSDDIQRGLQAGFYRYITKPIDIVKFNETISQLLINE